MQKEIYNSCNFFIIQEYHFNGEDYMLNAIWPVLIIVSLAYGIYTGNLTNLNEAIFNSSKDAVNLTMTLLGTMCLWSGLIEIASKTKMVDRLKKLLNPFVNYMFPGSKNNTEVKKDISMNIIANMLGLGNAATPLGLKAISAMQKDNLNKEELSNDMATLIILNTLSIQIIPTTIIAIRMSLGSKSPAKTIFAVWISSMCALITGIFLTKLCIRIEKKR